MIATLFLVFTLCFKGQCHEYIVESYSVPHKEALRQCKLDGTLLDEQNDNNIVWRCEAPTELMISYAPKINVN